MDIYIALHFDPAMVSATRASVCDSDGYLDGHLCNFLLGISLRLKLLSHGIYSHPAIFGRCVCFALFSKATDKMFLEDKIAFILSHKHSFKTRNQK